MNIPGAAADNPEMWDRAQEESDRLLEELKKEVKAEAEEVGTLRKRLTIKVPAKVIADRMEHNYSELMEDAFVPGFRKGRAPRRLIEKRYGADVRESLTTAMVGQAFYAVVENEEYDVLGDPLFEIEVEGGTKLVELGEALHQLKLPESGDFSYVCEIELKPKVELPALEGVEIKVPDIEITDEMVDDQMLQYRKNRGRLEPVDGAAQADDTVIADAVLTVDGHEVKREENHTLAVRGTSIDGIGLPKLADTLAGAKPGDERAAECTIPDDYERADLRGKSGKFAFKVHEVKRLKPEPVEDFLKAFGFEDEKEAREDFRAQIEAERDQMMERAKRSQVEEYLLEQTPLELPEQFSGRQTDRAVMRQVIDLQMRGVPMGDIESRIDEMRTSAKEQVARELKLSFILDKVADERDVVVTDEEVNTEIARMAQRYNRRFDRIRDDLQNRGLLNQLVDEIRHSKCIQKILDDAKLVSPQEDSGKKE